MSFDMDQAREPNPKRQKPSGNVVRYGRVDGFGATSRDDAWRIAQKWA